MLPEVEFSIHTMFIEYYRIQPETILVVVTTCSIILD